ncbi:MAG: CC/Se motif family (seleno)protein [Bacillota bacterium]|nr:CC/Se motif family (seleno)protein [Bacillota bacterium]
MKIIIRDELRLYLKKKNRNIISIMIRKIESGCVGSVQELDVRYNKVPEDVEKYNHFEIDGVDVYVVKNLKAKNDELTLSVKRSPLFIKELDIKGIELRL